MPARRIEVPPQLIRNARRVVNAGVEETGAIVLQNVAEVLGVPDLSAVDMLDVGCGVRFTQTILNRDIPIRSYTGVDVEPTLIRWLQANVGDPRFAFACWDVRNDMYNKGGRPFTRESKLPVAGQYDLICLYSVFTHLSPTDADAMLHVLRPHVRATGKLLFTAFVDDTVVTFIDRHPDKPLNVATYAEPFLRSLVEKTGWRVEKSIPNRRDRYVAHQFLCGPVTDD
jgi:SAM-dependent methyltransferase